MRKTDGRSVEMYKERYTSTKRKRGIYREGGGREGERFREIVAEIGSEKFYALVWPIITNLEKTFMHPQHSLMLVHCEL